ncbi:MAG TPA: S41 family peptidase [Azospirillaceae bacterium]|nr:S41 family peptidase [Azospirillaceae bacterium]
MTLRRILLAAVFSAVLLPAAAPAQETSAGPAHQAGSGEQTRFTEGDAVQLFVRALREVRERYVEPLSERELAEIAVQAMVGRDRWSKYYDEGQYRDVQADNQGSLVGVGIRFNVKPEGAEIAESFTDGPAAQAGLRSGDRILAIDGKPLAGLNADQVRTLIRGEEGSAVTLTLAAGEGARRDLRLVRKAITVPSVGGKNIDGFGYVRIAKFDQQTVPGFQAALRQISAQGRPRGLVIDLRDNPGGLVDACVKLADALLERGRILETRSRNRDGEIIEANAGDDTGGLPIVLLVNKNSASAAEILAGALQDNRRALLVGARTYGKGVIQSTRPVPGGGAIRLTTARYLTPAGHQVHEQGITPDFVLGAPDAAPVPWGERPDPANDVQLAQALTLLSQGGAPALARTTSAAAAEPVPAAGSAEGTR